MNWSKFDSCKTLDFNGKVSIGNMEQLRVDLFNKCDASTYIFVVASPATTLKLKEVVEADAQVILMSNTVSDDMIYLFSYIPKILFNPEECCVAGYNLIKLK